MLLDSYFYFAFWRGSFEFLTGGFEVSLVAVRYFSEIYVTSVGDVFLYHVRP